jgi:hypothetical protein
LAPPWKSWLRHPGHCPTPPIFWFFDPPAHVSAEGIAWIWDFCGSALAGNL